MQAQAQPARCFFGATDPANNDAAFRAGELVMDLVRRDVRPSHIVTRKAIENAIASVAASSTRRANSA